MKNTTNDIEKKIQELERTAQTKTEKEYIEKRLYAMANLSSKNGALYTDMEKRFPKGKKGTAEERSRIEKQIADNKAQIQKLRADLSHYHDGYQFLLREKEELESEISGTKSAISGYEKERQAAEAGGDYEALKRAEKSKLEVSADLLVLEAKLSRVEDSILNFVPPAAKKADSLKAEVRQHALVRGSALLHEFIQLMNESHNQLMRLENCKASSMNKQTSAQQLTCLSETFSPYKRAAQEVEKCTHLNEFLRYKNENTGE